MSSVTLNYFFLERVPVPKLEVAIAPFLAHSALRLTCNHAGYAPLWHEQVGDAWREERAAFDWPVLADDDARWQLRAAIDAVVADAYGLSAEQYAHVLSTFSHKSYPAAPKLCLAAFNELQELRLEAFTKKYDPYWDIPLNENLPQPVIELPQVSGSRFQVSGVGGQGSDFRDQGLVDSPAQGMLDFGEALAAQRAKRPVKKAAEKRERYQAALSDLPLFQGVITETAVDPHTVAASPAAYAQLTELLRERGVITSADAQALLGLDAVAVRSLLKQLVDEGLAVVEGEKRGTRYRRL